MKVPEGRVELCYDALLAGGALWLVCSLLHLVGLFTCGSSTAFFITLWALAAGVIFFVPTLKVSPVGKAVLITGCDSGFGFTLALHLDKLGFKVFAGCLDKEGEGAQKLCAQASPNLKALQLNVTSLDQVKAAAAEVKTLLADGEEVLWGIVNNAGISTFGEVEWVPESTYRRLLEVNAMGTVTTTRAFLPMVRKAKGRVVNVASMYGRMGNTMRSPYVMSKYAVEGFTDCLRQEMRSWGVNVSLIEPGNHVAATSIFTDESVRKEGESMWSGMREDVKQDYTKDYFDSMVATMMSYTNSGIQDTSAVIEAMTSAVTDKYPRARYLPMDPASRLRIAVATLLPAFVYDNIYTATHR